MLSREYFMRLFPTAIFIVLLFCTLIFFIFSGREKTYSNWKKRRYQ